MPRVLPERRAVVTPARMRELGTQLRLITRELKNAAGDPRAAYKLRRSAALLLAAQDTESATLFLIDAESALINEPAPLPDSSLFTRGPQR
jgi:hypothetical protein